MGESVGRSGVDGWMGLRGMGWRYIEWRRASDLMIELTR